MQEHMEPVIPSIIMGLPSSMGWKHGCSLHLSCMVILDEEHVGFCWGEWHKCAPPSPVYHMR